MVNALDFHYSYAGASCEVIVEMFLTMVIIKLQSIFVLFHSE